MTETPKSAQDLFDRYLPASLAANPTKAKELDAIYRFDVTGDGGGTWTVNLTASPPTCSRSTTPEPQCALELSAEDLTRILENPGVTMQLYFQGRLRVAGNPMLATKLPQLFAL